MEQSHVHAHVPASAAEKTRQPKSRRHSPRKARSPAFSVIETPWSRRPIGPPRWRAAAVEPFPVPQEARMYVIVYGVAIFALLVLYLLYGLLAGTWSLGKIVEGADGRPSTSKLQWFVW